MSTKITNDLLHANCWQSWISPDEGYFTFQEITLLYNPNDDVWGFAGEKYNIHAWEELLSFYHKKTGKQFSPGSPIPDEKQWAKNPADYFGIIVDDDFFNS